MEKRIGKGLCGDTPRCKEIGWQSFKEEDSTFYFVRNHFESIGKPILLKGGKVLIGEQNAHTCTSDSHQKHPQALPQKSVQSQISKNGATNTFHSVPPIPKLRQTLAKP